MSDGSIWKPNWRNVWIGSWIVSAALAALLTWSIFAGEADNGSYGRWPHYVAVWVMFSAMLTVIGVISVFRMTYDPADDVRRQQLREVESKNSATARATERALRLVASLLRRR